MSHWIAYLEMTLKPENEAPENGLELSLLAADWNKNEDWYRRVGSDWQWTDRLAWSETTWRENVERAGMETWVASIGGVECGYFELFHEGSRVRIVLLGLLPEFIGNGLGTNLLRAALDRAWSLEPESVFLDTCGRDHPNALANYLRQGFRIVRTEFADSCELA